MHSAFSLSHKAQTERVLRATASRYFSILAHPSGRLIGEREPCDIDLAFLDYGIGQARRGWLEAADVLNTRPLPALRRLLKSPMA